MFLWAVYLPLILAPSIAFAWCLSLQRPRLLVLTGLSQEENATTTVLRGWRIFSQLYRGRRKLGHILLTSRMFVSYDLEVIYYNSGILNAHALSSSAQKPYSLEYYSWGHASPRRRGYLLRMHRLWCDRHAVRVLHTEVGRCISEITAVYYYLCYQTSKTSSCSTSSKYTHIHNTSLCTHIPELKPVFVCTFTSFGVQQPNRPCKSRILKNTGVTRPLNSLPHKLLKLKISPPLFNWPHLPFLPYFIKDSAFALIAAATMAIYQGIARRASSSSTTTKDTSLSGLVSTLIPVFLLAAVYVAIFLVLRRKYTRNYAPRTYLGNVPP